MSEQEKEIVEETEGNAEPSAQKPEHKQTKYDLKMKRREEEKRKAARDAKIGTAVGILLIVAIIALIVSFPIRSYRTVNGTLFTVGEHKVTQIEFDYYYNTTRNNYLNTYGTMMSYYYGIDLTGDLSAVYYDDYLTFEDYFQQQAVEQIREVAALTEEAAKEGFSYDVEEDYADYLETLRETMVENGMTEKAFYAEAFGAYATESRLENVVKASLLAEKFYNRKADEMKPTDDEIENYYVENADDYDFVDYRMTSIAAELPVEPTELADEGAAVSEDGSYTPSDAEVGAAMADALILAEDAQKTIAEDGELYTGMTYTGTAYAVRSWMFDAERKVGDTTVEEYSYTNSYYVAAFLDRYRDTAQTRDVRMILTYEDNGEEIKAQFNAGDLSEESFIALVERYTKDTDSKEDGGLYEGQDGSSLSDEMYVWLFADERVKGDVESFYSEDEGTTYVLYYLGTDKPTYYFDIRTTLQSDNMNAYVEEIEEPYSVSDPKGNLEYLKKEAQREADEAAAELETSEEADSGE